jgi:hypothetical protein
VVLHGGRGSFRGVAAGAVVRGGMRLVGIAMLLMVASYVPLLIVGMLDPDSNPIGLGLLAMLGTAIAALIFGFALLRAVLRAGGVGR